MSALPKQRRLFLGARDGDSKVVVILVLAR